MDTLKLIDELESGEGVFGYKAFLAGRKLSPLRRQILEESAAANSRHGPHMKQRIHEAAQPSKLEDHLRIFDLNNDMKELPYARRRSSKQLSEATTVPEYSNETPDGMSISALKPISETNDPLLDELESMMSQDALEQSNNPNGNDLELFESTFYACDGSDGPKVKQSQLIVEAREIYNELGTYETSFFQKIKQSFDYDEPAFNHNRHFSRRDATIVGLYKSLLAQYHDFFATTQHPHAPLALRHLAEKYAMPTRMWRHGIQHFMDTTTRHLPDSVEQMNAFLDYTNGVLEALARSAPDMLDEWVQMQKALDIFRKLVRGLGPSADGTHSVLPPLGSFDFAPNSEFGDWFFRQLSLTTPQSPLEKARASQKLSDCALHALTGWLYHGQRLDSYEQELHAPAFNIYCKVFTLLCIAAELTTD